MGIPEYFALTQCAVERYTSTNCKIDLLKTPKFSSLFLNHDDTIFR